MTQKFGNRKLSTLGAADAVEILGADGTSLGQLITPSDIQVDVAALVAAARVQVWNSGQAGWDRWRAGSLADGLSNGNPGVSMLVYDSISGGGSWWRARTPNTFKGVRSQAINAAITIWTPAASKKFRLMAYRLMISGNAALAVATECLFKLQDGGVDIHGGGGDDVLIPGAAGAGPTLYSTPWQLFPGNGYLSTAANNTLTLAATGAAAALTNGHVDVIAAGMDE